MPATIGDLNQVFETVISNAIYLAGIAVILMLVWGGIQFLMAGGDKEATQKAGKTITFAIAGLVLVICSWLIINVLGNFLGVNFSIFNICLPGYSGPGCT